MHMSRETLFDHRNTWLDFVDVIRVLGIGESVSFLEVIVKVYILAEAVCGSFWASILPKASHSSLRQITREECFGCTALTSFYC